MKVVGSLAVLGSRRSARAEERWNVMSHCYVGKDEEGIVSGLSRIIEVRPSAGVRVGWVWGCMEGGWEEGGKGGVGREGVRCLGRSGSH